MHSTIAKWTFGTLKCVLYSEVFSIVSFIQSVLYRRFHCRLLAGIPLFRIGIISCMNSGIFLLTKYLLLIVGRQHS